MKKGWRIVLIIVLAAILLGAISMGVGILTGADVGRIYAKLDHEYQLGEYYDYFIQLVSFFKTALFG